MRTVLFIAAIAFAGAVKSQTTSIPDLNFELALIDLGHDTGMPDGTVPTANIESLYTLNIANKNISDLTGIEDFTALAVLRCEMNQLTTLDLSNNTGLFELHCEYNQLTNLDVTVHPALTYLFCQGNLLSDLDLSANPDLYHLDCSGNTALTSLDVSNNPALSILATYDCALTGLDVSNNPELEVLLCSYNQIPAIDLSYNPLLISLNIQYNQLTQLDVSMLPQLIVLDCSNNDLQCLNVSNGNNTAFWDFLAQDNAPLSCIEVDDHTWATANWGYIDAGVTFSNACGNACSTSTAKMNEESSGEISLYPNPLTGDLLFVEGVPANTSYRLISATGQVLRNGRTSDQPISLCGFEAGLYFLELDHGTGVRIEKLVKQ